LTLYVFQALRELGLSDEGLMRLIPKVHRKFHKDGELLDGLSESSKDWVHVVSGVVCSTIGSPETSIPLEIYGPGSWIFNKAAGFTSLTQRQSLGTSCVLHIPALLAHDLLKQDLKVANYVGKVDEWRGHLLGERLILSKAGDSWGRILLELALLGHSMMCSSSHMPRVMLDSTLRIPIKQRLLAAYLGVSRSLLIGGLRLLSAEGWLESGYGSIVLLKPKVWATLYSRHIEEENGFYQMTMPDLLRIMSQLEGEIYA